jgi:zinc D-Ala-D-Ala carboxypeptidase
MAQVPSISQTPAYSMTLIPVAVNRNGQMTGMQPAVAQRVVHLRYPEAPEAMLVPLDKWGRHKLLPNAASAFRAMQAEARKSGIQIEPVSAFRSMAVQKDVFHTEAVNQGVSLAERSKIAAPQGYSEHSTGYVVDVMDATSPQTTKLDLCFEQTPAFKWMMTQAKRFGYELSYPPKNWQGINYEPWHFRFVGDASSQSVFRRARTGQLA